MAVLKERFADPDEIALNTYQLMCEFPGLFHELFYEMFSLPGFLDRVGVQIGRYLSNMAEQISTAKKLLSLTDDIEVDYVLGGADMSNPVARIVAQYAIVFGLIGDINSAAALSAVSQMRNNVGQRVVTGQVSPDDTLVVVKKQSHLAAGNQRVKASLRFDVELDWKERYVLFPVLCMDKKLAYIDFGVE